MICLYTAVPVSTFKATADFIQYRSYDIVGVVARFVRYNSRSEYLVMIKFDLRTGILLFCPKNATKFPDKSVPPSNLRLHGYT